MAVALSIGHDCWCLSRCSGCMSACIDVFHLHHKIGCVQGVAAIFGSKNSMRNIHESESVCCVFAPSQADSQNLSSLKAT